MLLVGQKNVVIKNLDLAQGHIFVSIYCNWGYEGQKMLT